VEREVVLTQGFTSPDDRGHLDDFWAGARDNCDHSGLPCKGIILFVIQINSGISENLSAITGVGLCEVQARLSHPPASELDPVSCKFPAIALP
jgi:hypothetical protein